MTLALDMSKFDTDVIGWGKTATNVANKEIVPRYIDIRTNDDEYQLVVTTRKMNFSEATRKLGILALNPIKLCNAHTFDVDKEILQKAFKEINDKIVQIRNAYFPPMRFLLSLFHELPFPVKSFCLNHPEQGLQTFFNPYQYKKDNNLPFSSTIVEALSIKTVRYTIGTEHRFCSFRGRLNCLQEAIKGVVLTIITPLGIPHLAIRKQMGYQWKNKLHAAVDVIYAMVLTPCIAIVFAIKMLAAAIFHPGLVYRPL